jgi:hypothetical protein
LFEKAMDSDDDSQIDAAAESLSSGEEEEN